MPESGRVAHALGQGAKLLAGYGVEPHQYYAARARDDETTVVHMNRPQHMDHGCPYEFQISVRL